MEKIGYVLMVLSMKIKKLREIIQGLPDNVELCVMSSDPDSDVEFLIDKIVFDTVDQLFIEINI